MTRTRQTEIKVLHVKALWGERKVTKKSVPYRGDTVDERRVESLWVLPATPPHGFKAGRESSFRVPGNDVVVDCDTCSAKNGSQAGGSSCHVCGGAGKVLKYELCDTKYHTENFVDSTSEATFPEKLLAPEAGKRVFQDYVFYPPGKDSQADYEKKCLDALAKQAGSDVRDKLVDRLFHESARKSLTGKERRLIRVSLEISTVPLQEFLCEPRDPGRERTGWRFRMWLYGKRGRLHVAGYPRALTWKAAAWCLFLTLLGAPVGFALMRLIS